MTLARWDRAIFHRDAETVEFLQQYFAGSARNVLFVGGAGFDPRSALVAHHLARTGLKATGLLIREERPGATSNLKERGDAHAAEMSAFFNPCETLSIEVLDPQDGAVVGAKKLLRELQPRITENYTDIVVDLSALSIGMSFPLVRHLFALADARELRANVHILVTPDAELDTKITAEHVDHTMYVPGFDGGASLDSNAGAARLWVPQLVSGKREALRHIHNFLESPETCPILPFPARDLRRGDRLIEHFTTELEDAWDVDPRNFIYAAEEEPLDLYRTLLRLAEARDRVFRAHGGSLLVLSPVGSKCLALGALLAALERNFPVAYLEALSYAVDSTVLSKLEVLPNPVHLWLTGDVYE